MADNIVTQNNDVPLLHQWDDRWSSEIYRYSDGSGGSSIAASACGPTCFAMIARWYSVPIFPPEACDYATEIGCHVSGGTQHDFFEKAAEHWSFSMEAVHDKESVIDALKKGYPVIAAHGAGMFTSRGHFIVYAKLSGADGLIVNDPNQGCGPNRNGDNYVFNLEEVLNDGNVSDWFIPTKNHNGCQPLMADQSAKGEKTADGSYRNQSGDQGFRVTPVGPETVRITKLPERKCYAEPIYPDYITVSDTVPKWVLDATTGNENSKLAQASGENIPNGDAPEKAPNGMNYSENDIKHLIESTGVKREQAIETLSKDTKYTREVKRNKDGTFTVKKSENSNG